MGFIINNNLNELNNLDLSPTKSVDKIYAADFPVVICSTEWKVIYRNESAYHDLSRFRMSSCIKRLCNPSELKEIEESGNAAFVTFEGEQNKRALVCQYNRGGQRCFVVAFFAWAQVDKEGNLTSELEKNSLCLINSLKGDLSDVDTGFVSNHPKYSATRNSKLREIAMRDLSLFLYPNRPHVFDCSKNLRSIHSLLSYFSSELFVKLGYNLTLEIQDQMIPSRYYIESFNSFCSVFTDLLVSALDESIARSARVRFAVINFCPAVSIFIKRESPCERRPDSPAEFAELFKNHRISAFVCASICNRLGWRFGVFPDEFDKTELEIRIYPKTTPPRFIVREQIEDARTLYYDFFFFINNFHI